MFAKFSVLDAEMKRLKYILGIIKMFCLFSSDSVFIRGSCKKVLSLGSDYFRAMLYQTYKGCSK